MKREELCECTFTEEETRNSIGLPDSDFEETREYLSFWKGWRVNENKPKKRTMKFNSEEAKKEYLESMATERNFLKKEKVIE